MLKKKSDSLLQYEETDKAVEQHLARMFEATKPDITKAEKVILIRGISELFLIPLLVKKVMGVDLKKEGISVIPIYGIHFHVFTDLIRDSKKKTAIICGNNDDGYINQESANTKYLKVFKFEKDFQESMLIPGLLTMFAATVNAFEQDQAADNILKGYQFVMKPGHSKNEKKLITSFLEASILSTINQVGSSKFFAVIPLTHV